MRNIHNLTWTEIKGIDELNAAESNYKNADAYKREAGWIAIGYEMETGESNIVIQPGDDHRKTYSSDNSADWGKLDSELGGRANWQKLIADHAKLAQAELAELDD